MVKNHCYWIKIESDDPNGYADVYNGTTRLRHFVGPQAITEAAKFLIEVQSREYNK